MTAIGRSFLLSGLDRFGNVLLNLIMTATVARLLRPDEIGVFLVGASIVQITQSLREFGAGVYIIQEAEITAEGIRTTFTVMMVLSLALAGLLYATSGPVASFYTEPRLQPVLQIAAAGLVLACIGNAPVALMQREFAFARVTVISLVSAVVNLVAVLAFIMLGFGYLSPAWAGLVSIAAQAGVTLVCRPDVWIYRPCLTEWRRVLAFGGYSSMTALLANLTFMLPQFIIGRMMGFAAVGIYSRASLLCQIPDRTVLSAFTPVILPALSAQVREGGDLRRAYLRALSFVSAVYLPSLACLALLAAPAVDVLFGRQWSSAVPVVRIMAIASLALFPASLTYPTLVATGRIRDTVTLSLVCLPVTALLIAGGCLMSLEAVAATIVVSAPVQSGLSLWFIRRRIGFDWREAALALRPSAVATLFAVAPPAASLLAAGPHQSLPVAALALAGAMVGWVVGLRVAGHPMLDLAQGLLGLVPGRLRMWMPRRAAS